jgi:adenosylmethionine-8-amino-7-oxononanoate aminotransferase
MSHIVHRNLLKDPPIAVSGQGIWLRDSTGHDVIDGSGGAAVACLGHGHPHVVSAMKAQIDRLC